MNVAVLGVGPTGREVTGHFVRGGHDVSIHTGDPSAAMDAIDTVERRLDGPAGELDATTSLAAAVSDADLVVETGVDSQAGLCERFEAVETLVDDETLVATAHPSLSVTAAAADLARPDRVLGLRLYPDDKPVVEVVVTGAASAETLDRAETVVESLDATPLFVGDTPGPVSSRLAVALELEAMELLADDVAGVETIDELLVRGTDHETGPLERADRVGLDRRLDLLGHLASEVDDRYRPPDLLVDRVAVGKTGRAAGEGFYVWEDGEPVRPAVGGPEFGRPD